MNINMLQKALLGLETVVLTGPRIRRRGRVATVGSFLTAKYMMRRSPYAYSCSDMFYVDNPGLLG